MIKDRSYGVIVMRKKIDSDHWEFLLIHQRAGHWGFPKGHLEEGETLVEAAARELAEETGLHGVEILEEPVFSEEHIFTNSDGKDISKTVTYFLGKVIVHEDVKTQPEEVQNYVWSNAKQTRQLITFEELRQLFDKVCAYLQSN